VWRGLKNSRLHPGHSADQGSGIGSRSRSIIFKSSLFRAKLHDTDTGYEHRLRTPTDKLNNNSTTNLPHRNARAQHLGMSRCWDVANFCPLVVFVAGVRVVEFGSYYRDSYRQPRIKHDNSRWRFALYRVLSSLI